MLLPFPRAGNLLPVRFKIGKGDFDLPQVPEVVCSVSSCSEIQNSVPGWRTNSDAQAARRHVAAPAANPEVSLKGFYRAVPHGGKAGSDLHTKVCK